MRKNDYIILIIIFNKEKDGRWTAECEQLGTATYADTLEQVEKEIVEMVELHLNALESVGERKRFFKENKIKMFTGKPDKTVKLTIPTNAEFAKPIIHRFENSVQVC